MMVKCLEGFMQAIKMNKLKFIINEIKKGRTLFILFSILTYPLSKTKLKEWRLKTKDLILVRNLTKQIKKNYGLKFLNTYSKFYCEELREIYEYKIYHFFKIKKGDVVYDVGAGGGTYSLLSAKNGAECLAFELREDAFKIMNENIKLNNFQNKIKTYLGKIDDKIALDFYFNKTKKAPTLIKIDIEGDELKALKGSIKILKKYHPRIIFETHSKELERACLDFLSKFGYAVKNKIRMNDCINLFFLK